MHLRSNTYTILQTDNNANNDEDDLSEHIYDGQTKSTFQMNDFLQ